MPEGSSNSMGSGGCVGILGRGSSGISRGTAGSPSDSTSAVDTPSLRASLSARVSPFASSPSCKHRIFFQDASSMGSFDNRSMEDSFAAERRAYTNPILSNSNRKLSPCTYGQIITKYLHTG